MTSKAPITPSVEVADAFKAAKSGANPNFGWMQIGINLDNNSFKLMKNNDTSGNRDDDWQAMQGVFVEKNHTFIITRDVLKPQLFLLIHFAPDLSPVRQRMLYASSRGTLKSQLGTANFAQDYHIDQINECDAARLIDHRTLHERVELRTDEEILKQETAHETAPKTIKSSVMKSLPIELTDSGKEVINKFNSGEYKTVFLELNIATQAISGSTQSATSIADIQKVLPDSNPRYMLFYFSDPSESNSAPQRLFGYYCPASADRKEKFTYSTCKTNVIEYCQSVQLQFFSKVEFTSKEDVNSDFLAYHVFPKHEEKVLHAKPSAPGRKKKGGRKLNVKVPE